MIWTDNILNFKRSDAELEELIIFLIFVANKPAHRMVYLLEQFLEGNLDQPFEFIRKLIKNNGLGDKLRLHRVGQYTRIEKSLTELVNTFTGAQLRTVTPEDLETIHGIGMKSSRCFCSWSQENVRYSMLDVHILSFMREELGINTPKSTPPKKKYLELEKIFLNLADKLKKTPAELDLMIWVSRRI